MATRWYVGCDGSPSSVAALRWAARRAAERNAIVTPVSTFDVPIPVTGALPAQIDVQHEAFAAHAASAFDATVRDAGVAGGARIGPPEVVEGHPAVELVDRSGPDAIVVVGRRGISALRHRLLGSVSSYVATHANGPVVVVNEGCDAPQCRKLVVGFDGSEHAVDATRWALDFVLADGSVRVVMAIEIVPWLRDDLVQSRFPDEVRDEDARLQRALDAIDPDHRAERDVVLHGARQALAEASVGSDLVVVGARGHGAIGSAILGSVTTWMLHGASCPVAVIP